MSNILKALIIDGDPAALDKLSQFIDKIEYLQVVKACLNTAEAIEYMNTNPVDVIFTEISMPGTSNGIEFVESLASVPLVVFVSAQKDYALDVFRLGAVDFLLKPYDMMSFQRAATRVLDAYRRRPAHILPADTAPGYIFIRNGKEYDKVKLSDIIYISGDAEYLAFHIDGYDTLLREKSSFAAIRRLLPSEFVQVHRSNMINISHVSRIGKSYVVMDDGTQLRVSDSYRDAFYSKVATLTVGKKLTSTD